MLDNSPNNIIHKIYAINKLDHGNNSNFPLAKLLIKLEQDCDGKIQDCINGANYKNRIDTMTFGNLTVYTIDKK